MIVESIKCSFCYKDFFPVPNIMGQVKCPYCRNILIITRNEEREAMTNDDNANQISDELLETKSKLILLYDYEKHYLQLIKDYKEEIKFANTLQEDLRRERAQFFTQTLKDVIQTMRGAEVANDVAAKWIQELVESYKKSIDLSSDLAKTHVVEILNTLTVATKKQAADAGLDNIGQENV